jgi:DNA-binding GntR family transcriptional regulator
MSKDLDTALTTIRGSCCPARGFHVRRNDVLDARLVIERYAVERIIADGAYSQAVYRDLNHLIGRLHALTECGSAEAFARADWRFHRRIVLAAGNDPLSVAHASLADHHLEALVCAFAGASLDRGWVVVDHEALLCTLMASDAEEACSVVARHISAVAGLLAS